MMKRLKALKEDRILNSIAELKAAANACGWSRVDLQMLYNAIPGAPPKKRLRNRPTAIEAIWKALPVYDGNSESSKGARPRRQRADVPAPAPKAKRENGHKKSGWNDGLRSAIESNFDLGQTFTSKDVKRFEQTFQLQFPTNTAIAAGLRRTLQQLRDMGFIEFMGRGEYRRV
jgi:DpnI-like restriction endonuclease